MDPATKLYFVEVEEPDMHKPTGDLERLAHALKDQWDIDNVTCDLGVMTKLQPRLRKGNWQASVAVYRDHKTDQARILDCGQDYMKVAYMVWPSIWVQPRLRHT